MSWIENYLNGFEGVSSSTKCSWRTVISGEPQRLTVNPVLFKLFIKDLDDGSELSFAG